MKQALAVIDLSEISTKLIKKPDDQGCLGQVIRALRRERKLSQEELALKSRVSRTTIARLECGFFKSLSLENLEQIALALNLDLKTLLLKARALGDSVVHRGHLEQVSFVLDCPEEGWKIAALMPRRREFFFGRLELQPQKTALAPQLPQAEQICLQLLEGRVLWRRSEKECLMRPGDNLGFSGLLPYELYNPDLLHPAKALVMTYPSFLPL